MSRHSNERVWLARWPAGDVHIQLHGRERSLSDLKRSVLVDMDAAAGADEKIRVDSLDVYVKPEDGRAYYVAGGNAGSRSMTGSVAL